MTVERRELLEAALEGYRIQRETTAEKMRAITEELETGKGAGATITITEVRRGGTITGLDVAGAGGRGYAIGDRCEVVKRRTRKTGAKDRPVPVRAISEEGKARIRAAQKKRWREFRKARNKAV